MAQPHPSARLTLAGLALVVGVLTSSSRLIADTIQLKNGTIYRGTVDRDNTLIWVFDGLKRVVIRESKVARIESDASFRNLEIFKIEQPLIVHSGAMPKEVMRVEPGPWNDRGRRLFAFEGARAGKVVRMEQAINELGPHLVRIRGVDGFWQAPLAMTQVPKDVVLAILGKVRTDLRDERVRVVRWLIQAEWYKEAREEIARIGKDFPDDTDLRERLDVAASSVSQLESLQLKAVIDRMRKAQQPRAVTARLRAFPEKDVSADVLAQIDEARRADTAQSSADKALADDLQSLSEKLTSEEQTRWKKPLLEALLALKEAPDAVRDRFLGWQKVRLDGEKPPSAEFALAMSGFVLGQDAAVDDLASASTFWMMRDQVRDYLSSSDSNTRGDRLAELESTSIPATEDLPLPFRKLDVVTRLAQHMVPPLHDDEVKKTDEKVLLHRVRDDANVEPTDYMIAVPPEYHPLRQYPAVVALHDGSGPRKAIDRWASEAANRGYVVIAPEYKSAGEAKGYTYSMSEHAAVELALRDAKRRYAIDSDRVFVAGHLEGGNMAWDFGMAHPDLFAGVIVISGFPGKYVLKYNRHAENVPLYVALGDLAPAANEFVFGQILKPMIAKGWDVTYLEYLRRGLEDLPEEIGPAFEWMDRRRRDPYPKTFEVVTARASDIRFNGLVIREFLRGYTLAPEAVDPLGKNLNPATVRMRSSSLSNLLAIEAKGVKRLDLWVSPKQIDFKRRMEVRINKDSYFKGLAKPELEPMLEDLRIRADRQQVYWLKVSAG